MRKEDVNNWCFVVFLIGSFCAITWFFTFLSNWENYSIRFKIIGIFVPTIWILFSYGILANNRFSAIFTLYTWLVWTEIFNFKMGRIAGLIFSIPFILLHLKVLFVIYSNTEILKLNRKENKFKQLFGKKQLNSQNKLFHAWVYLFLLGGFFTELYELLTSEEIHLRKFLLIYAFLIITLLWRNRLFKFFMDILFVTFIFHLIVYLSFLGTSKIQLNSILWYSINSLIMSITYAFSIKYIKILHNHKNAPDEAGDFRRWA